MQSFAIYPVNVGAGIMAMSPMPGRGGDYADDLSVLLEWSPDLVVSMTQAHEFAGPLAADLKNVGVRWVQVPVADFGVPLDHCGWDAAAVVIAQVLADQGKVLVHCMGGCGRSGMAVLRCMIAAGDAPYAALARLRNARPCAVETDAQLDWAAV